MSTTSRQSGISSVQVLVSAVIFGTVLMASVSYSMTLSSRFGKLRSAASSASVATAALAGIERALYQAEPAVPAAFLLADLGPGDSTLTLDRVSGLPPQGALLVRGPSGTERITYDDVDQVASVWTLSLTSSVSVTQPAGSQVRLATLGILDDSITALDVGHFGQTLELTGVREFLGNGSAVVFRKRLTDGSYGAVIDGTPVTGAWHMLAFEAAAILTEAEVGRDLNFDGDQTDSFDVGRLRNWTWPPHGSAGSADSIAVTPTVIVQERGVWGGDLDADGGDDPLFSLDPDQGVLRISLFTILGSGPDTGIGTIRSTVRLRASS